MASTRWLSRGDDAIEGPLDDEEESEEARPPMRRLTQAHAHTLAVPGVVPMVRHKMWT